MKYTLILKLLLMLPLINSIKNHRDFIDINEISTYQESFVYDKTEYLLFNVELSWMESSIVCEGFSKGSLAVIDTYQKAHFLGEALSETDKYLNVLWIGATKSYFNNTKGFMWVNNRGFYVPDQMFITRGRESFNLSQYRNCLGFARKFHDVPSFIDLVCTLKRPFICEQEYVIRKNGSMTTDWFHVGKVEYGIFFDWVTWRQAVRDCRKKHNAHLASFRNLYEIEAVSRNLLVGRPSLENAWIGGYYNGENWTFIYGETIINEKTDPVTCFPPWRKDNKHRKHSGCLLLDRHTISIANFQEARCSRKRSYVCERALKEEINSTVIILNKLAYILFYPKVYWEEAEEECEKFGSVLAKVTPSNIHDLMYLMGENSSEIRHVWIGGKLIENEQTNELNFHWVSDGSFIPPNNENSNFYPPWLDGEINKKASCLNMDRENHNRALFYGLNCNERQSFICQLNDLSKLDLFNFNSKRDLYKNKTHRSVEILNNNEDTTSSNNLETTTLLKNNRKMFPSGDNESLKIESFYNSSRSTVKYSQLKKTREQLEDFDINTKSYTEDSKIKSTHFEIDTIGRGRNHEEYIANNKDQSKNTESYKEHSSWEDEEAITTQSNNFEIGDINRGSWNKQDSSEEKTEDYDLTK